MVIFQKPKYQFVFFLILFFIINLLQSNYTRLFEDEAYYWVWSKNLAFGYFDHPPLVALWVKISSFFFEGELGVRFFSTISFSLMLIIIWEMIDVPKKQKYVWLYFLLVISMALLNIYGFITSPDTPLLLFVALFLYTYKLFLKNESWFNVLLLGFSMAGMMYSKYHGILVIFFIIFSNFSLLKNKKFWIACLFGFVLFTPHLYWQYVNDFPSFRYHLMERSKKPYRISNSIMHIVNQIAIVGITFPVVYNALFKQKITSKFDKSLIYLVYGFIIFFFIASFSSSTQAQWTGVILIPLIILTFDYFIQNKKARKRLIILGSIQFILLLVFRIFLANSSISPIKLETHFTETWIPVLNEKTKSKPLVFVNSYKNASLYTFYTGIKTHSYSILKGRKSQFDLIDFEENMQHENIYIASKFLKESPVLINIDDVSIKGYPIQNYTSFQKVRCIIENDQLIMNEGEKVNFQFKFTNTYHKNISFEHVKFIGVFQGYKNKILAKVPVEILNISPLEAKEEKLFKASIKAPVLETQENVSFRIALEFYDLLEGFQGNKVKVKIAE